MTGERDLLIVGGGICGLSLAVHAARQGHAVTLVEAGELGGESTQRSGALLRAHYEDESSARLAQRGIEHFASFAERYGGSAGYRATGFAFVPEAEEISSGALAGRVKMLLRLGIETQLLDPSALRRIDSGLDISDVGLAAYEPEAGHAEPALATATLIEAARRDGAELRARARVERLLAAADGAVHGARLECGETIAAAQTVLCAGAWSAELCRPLGLELPLRPTAVKLAFFERSVPIHLTAIDAPGGIYLRPYGETATLVGRRTWTDEPLASVEAELPVVGAGFVEDALARLERRLPSARGARTVGARTGMLDMTPDGLPLVGPLEVDGLWLCCGWSGTGFKTGPAVGEALAVWLRDGERPPALASFAPGRKLVPVGAPRSPN